MTDGFIVNATAVGSMIGATSYVIKSKAALKLVIS